jgi:hypothetical protein
LEQPLLLSRAPAQHVWHCALRTAPADRTLTDAEWDAVAREVLDRTGLAPRDDDGACRWVAVRHAEDHIHLVVVLARQDGGRVPTSNDFYKVGQACRAVEDRLGLTRTGARDRTAARRPTRGESEKAARTGRPTAARTQLRRHVQTAAAAADSPASFLAGLERSGVLVRERRSDRDHRQITGYAVALPGDRTAAGLPVWFGGGKLAPDLSWPQLLRRWGLTGPQPAARSASVLLVGTARDDAWRRAAHNARTGAATIRQLMVSDPAAAADAAHATADALRVTAHLVEGRHGGPLTDAADTFDRAAREPWRRTQSPTPLGHSLRASARMLAMLGRASHDEATQVLALLAGLAALAESVAVLRTAQQREVQAVAARSAADALRAVAPPTRSSVGPVRVPTPRHPSALATAGRPR